MPKEIERKFTLLTLPPNLEQFPSLHIVQGYFDCNNPTVRIRLVNRAKAYLTVKGPAQGLSRDEFEYEVPYEDGLAMLGFCADRRVEKTRYLVPATASLTWEVDVFEGKLRGLVVAEIELPDENTMVVNPAWLGTEVSDFKSLTNKQLALAQTVPALPRGSYVLT